MKELNRKPIEPEQTVKPERAVKIAPKKPLYANDEMGFVREYIGKVIQI